MRQVVIALSALGMLGCIGVEDFDPVGNAASIAGSWTIDGAPPSEASCEALGASTVQVSFLDDLRPVPHTGLRFECRIGTFDTDGPGGSGKVIAAPDVVGQPWRLRLEATNGAGTLLAVGETLTVFVPATERIEIPEARFVTSTVVAAFGIGGANASAMACRDLGVFEVELIFADATGVVDEGREPCEVGLIGARVTPGRDYTVSLRAYADDGSVRGETTPETITATSGAEATLAGGATIDLAAL